MAQLLDTELHKYWELLDMRQKSSVISMIKSLLQPVKKESHVSVEQYNKELDEAMARIDAGKFTTQEDMEIESEKW